MYPYEPAENQPCFYCKKIKKSEISKTYPVRSGIYTLENYIYRCAWHARFKCSKCGDMHHFGRFYWCPTLRELICNLCTQSELKPIKFCYRTTAFEFPCDHCDENHFDLLFSEFLGTHPWQYGAKNLISIVESLNPWDPIWIPSKLRSGEPISLEDALQIENNAFKLRKFYGDVIFVEGLTAEDEIDYEDSQNRWEKASKDWIKITTSQQDTDEGDFNRQLVIDPALWKLFGDVSELSILDAGCGNGYLSRKLTRKGGNVIGVDHSRQLIDFCKQKAAELKLNCSYYHASLTNLSIFEENSFDLIVSNIVMVDVLDYKTAFKEIKRVLKDNGRFIWSNSHPVFGRWGAVDFKLPLDTPRKEERLCKVVDRYFHTGGTLISWNKMNPVWQFERTLEEYSQALKEAGFVISEIIEPRPEISVINKHPMLAFDFERFSQFIILECLPYKF